MLCCVCVFLDNVYRPFLENNCCCPHLRAMRTGRVYKIIAVFRMFRDFCFRHAPSKSCVWGMAGPGGDVPIGCAPSNSYGLCPTVVTHT